MEMMLALCGYSGAGKSTLARAIRDSASHAGTAVIEKLGHVIYQMHEAIRDVLLHNGIDSMEDKDRQLLQFLGNEWGRAQLGEHVWVDALIRRVRSAYTARELVIVDDLRSPSDAEALRTVFGPQLYIIRVRRPGVAPLDHSSDRAVDNIADPDIEVTLSTDVDQVMQSVYEQLAQCFRRRLSNGLIVLPDLDKAEVEAALVDNLNNQ